MTTLTGANLSRMAVSFQQQQRSSLEVSHSSSTQVTTGSFSHSESASFRASYQADSFTRGGCAPQPTHCGGTQGDELMGAVNQVLQDMANFFQACADFLSSPQCQPQPGSEPQPSGCEPPPVDCKPSPSPDCEPSPSPGCPSEPEPHCPPSGKEGKMWDVFFDAKSGTKTKQKSPIVLDLNGNGKADITGSNIKGNGKMEGQTVKGFDLDPSNRQWTTKSVQRRPGKGAPELPPGSRVEVFDAQGKKVKSLDASALNKAKAKSGDMGLGLGKGMRAEFRDAQGKLVGELKTDDKKKQLMYHFGNVNENEWTKAWDSKKGGDGILAWDADGDGQITSGKEIFGHVDLDGKNRFANGYEKLQKYFDKDGNGRVEGSEMKGLKVWEDRNGDGVTQKGELVELASRGINSLNTRFNANDMSSSFKHD